MNIISENKEFLKSVIEFAKELASNYEKIQQYHNKGLDNRIKDFIDIPSSFGWSFINIESEEILSSIEIEKLSMNISFDEEYYDIEFPIGRDVYFVYTSSSGSSFHKDINHSYIPDEDKVFDWSDDELTQIILAL